MRFLPSVTRIHPLEDLGPDLLEIEKPARYLGGELGSFPPLEAQANPLTMALCFPDLYEIGMSNNAIRLLYAGIADASQDIRCERVFAPAPDFEALLKRRGLPLYTLESGLPLQACDIVGFSVGYELLGTNIVTVLAAGGVPVRAADRGESDPIVIAGGPAVSNPHPFGIFLDAAWIGEAEGGFYSLMAELAALKRQGATRADLRARIASDPHFWAPGPGGRKAGRPALRAIYDGFADTVQSSAYPVPVLKTVQDHGTVEIMRGCPNGCRFCHAGYFYRPQRVKPASVIDAEVESLVRKGGYREITLSSLSSGDYPGIHGLIRALNRCWSSRGVSFQLPSLKIDTFTLPLLDELAEVRKSGLTFAVETPVDRWQGSINKIVSLDKTLEILREARSRGFRQAKFYFMIGLPVPGRGVGEAEEILAFIGKILREERMPLSLNVGTFVPKPHTPYEREAQISEQESLAAIQRLREGLRSYRNVKLSFHSPFTSMLEGIIARGDERVGELILRAWESGARLDAWDEHFDREFWRGILEGAGFDPVAEFLAARPQDAALPWSDVRIMVSDVFMAREKSRSDASELTGSCMEDCDHFCGACGDKRGIVHKNIQDQEETPEPVTAPDAGKPAGTAPIEELNADYPRLVLRFEKTGKAVFYPMHSVSGAFARAFMMQDFPVKFSEGFNPLPKMELAPPLPLGVASTAEILSIWITRPLESIDIEALVREVAVNLPEGMRVTDHRIGLSKSHGKRSIGSLYRGSTYRIACNAPDAHAIPDAQAAIDAVIMAMAAVGDGAEILKRDESGTAVEIALDDAQGGVRNLSRIIESVCAERPVYRRYEVTRTGAYGRDEGGKRMDMFSQL